MTALVVPHNPTWSDAFHREADAIMHALGATALDVQHIGSTAIRHIAAKPIIDVLLFVSDLDELDAKMTALEAMKYEAKGEFGIGG
ncbi:MAG TPA: GrpB family protein, partial [Casimicrobium sp.]|nr:GrpB family protein [Casimicrobium sp.]